MPTKVERAFLKFEKGPTLKCQFNPEKLTIHKANDWSGGGKSTGKEKASGAKEADVKPKGIPVAEYAGAKPGTMSLDLVFDTTDTGESVMKYTQVIFEQMEVKSGLPQRSQKMGNDRPPYVLFVWGTNVSWPAAIDSADVTFEFFSSTGVPLRARVALKLTQAMPSDAYTRQNPTSGTPMPHRVHRVQRGETLDRISAQYYGDSTRWRMLADANGIEDPLGIRPGSLISVPELGSG